MQKTGRYMGIDFGEKRVGIALSDALGTMAFPKIVLPNDQKLVEAISTLATENEVKTIVCGESKTFSGMENPIMVPLRKMAGELEKRGFSIVYEPEFLSSHEVSQQSFDIAKEGNRREDGRMGRQPNKKEVIDASVAALILKSYLERKK